MFAFPEKSALRGRGRIRLQCCDTRFFFRVCLHGCTPVLGETSSTSPAMSLWRMVRRCLYSRWLQFACVAVAVIAIWWLASAPPRAPFTRGQYDRIKLGMTLEDAIKVMGLPPGTYFAADPPSDMMFLHHEPDNLWPLNVQMKYGHCNWYADSAFVELRLFQGRICEKAFLVPEPAWRRWLNVFFRKMRNLFGM
jgi:hypothetical protein